MPINKQFTVGGDIESMCTKCREVRNHTIVAMVENKVARVECNTCGGVHNYRPPKNAATPRTRKASDAPKRKSSRASADQEQWEKAVAGKGPGEVRSYDMGAGYKADELVEHPTFGLGIVTATFKPNKMEVLFQDGRKTMRCQL